MLASTRKTIADVKALRIQGAEKVAVKSVEALAREAQASKARDRNAFIKELRAAAGALKETRPTEPALRNSIRFLLATVQKSGCKDTGELKEIARETARDYLEKSLETKLKIAKYGAKLVPDGGSVLLHCHSSTVMRILKKAHDDGKHFQAYCLEARPLYQGRVSAAELSSYGVKTTLCVDSCGQTVLSKMTDADAVLVGADAVTAEGDLVNKIGTAGLAILADQHDKRFYSCTGTHKFDPLTLWGESEPIEERPPDEVLDKAAKRKWGFKRMPRILNPAFDLTPGRLVTGFVTELGVVPPQSLVGLLWKEYGLQGA